MLFFKEIANIINCEYVGDALYYHTGMNEIHVVEKEDCFVDHPKYYDKSFKLATVILINKKVDCPEGKALLFLNPFRILIN
jgi:UDP-3-O-[3-hydroxymyristoyl] glucosamine N-acyltransferase